ncbi:hypothetical protein OEZ85_011390 [Tetradesmus obliquus]|uniref:ERD4-related membrane protein n=1 Tax=Tetradesmus obliquus TaxID=3088 RepID=A0ABY8TQA9_TETOB|nr:hypothetical protein OEZ85_011390 [Tetradesmus obliquus]
MPLPGAPLPPVLPKTLLTWVVPLLRLPEQRVIAAVGLDVAMLLRFIRFALKLLLVLMVWCIGVVLPVNYSGTNLQNLTQQQLAANAAAAPAAAAAAAAAPPGFFGSLFPTIPNINSSLLPEYLGRRPAANINSSSSSSSSTGGAPKVQLGPGQDVGSLAQQIEQGRVGASDLDVLSMANIPAGSPLLWVHLASVYVVSAITLKLLWSATSDALRLYLAHLSSSSMNLDSASHTALLTDIPGMPRGTLIDKVLHTALFGLLPSAVKRRLRATWTQFFAAAAARGRSRPAGRVQPGQKKSHKGSSSSSSSSSRAAGSSPEEEELGDGCQQQQQQQRVVAPVGGSALDVALRAQQAQGLSAGVGGVGVFSDEWRRAARALQGASLEEFVLREFQEVYGPHNVVAVHIVSYSPRIAKLVMQYNTTRLALEDLLDDYSKQLHEAVAAAGRRKKRSQAASLLAAPFVRCCGNGQQQQHLGQQHAPLQAIKVRTLPLPKQTKKQQAAAAGSTPHDTGSSASSHDRVAAAAAAAAAAGTRLQQQLAAAQREAAEDPLPAAFVTFRTRTALTAAVSSHHVAEAGVWKLTAAPPPDSLNWGKLGLRYWEVGLRRGAVYSVLALLGLFYVVPVAVVQGLLQLERLQALPVIGKLVSLPGVRSLLLGVLPGLALRIFVLLLPVILYALNRRAGPVGAAQLDGWVATHFFALQVIIVFFASFITGSLFNQINVLFTQGLAPVLDRLGTGAPQTANFFILYIIFTAFIGRSWALLRPWGLLMSSIRALAARNRGRSGRRRALLVGTYRMFGPSVPEHSMMLLLALVLSVIAPLVLAAAFVFFCMAIVVESYNWVWVFRRPYEGGGRLWKQLFRHVFIALYIFQLIMAALLIVKRFVWVVLLLPLFFLTALTQHIGSKLLQRSWDVLSVRAAHELDLQDRQEAAQALRFWRQPQLAGQLAGNLQEGGGLAGKQQLRAGSAGAAAAAAGVDVDASFNRDGEGTAAASAEAREAEEVCRSQAAQWAQLYRPPAEQLLEAAGPLQETLAARVGAVQTRLAAHNAAAAAEAGLKRQAKQALGRV